MARVPMQIPHRPRSHPVRSRDVMGIATRAMHRATATNAGASPATSCQWFRHFSCPSSFFLQMRVFTQNASSMARPRSTMVRFLLWSLSPP